MIHHGTTCVSAAGNPLLLIKTGTVLVKFFLQEFMVKDTLTDLKIKRQELIIFTSIFLHFEKTGKKIQSLKTINHLL